MDTTDLTTAFETTITFAGSPERVFPLLCPVREYDWIPDWSCTIVHSASGVAELGCVFTREQGETWITTRYEPPTVIEYTILSPGQTVAMLRIALVAASGTTTATVRSTNTALSPTGADQVRAWTPELQQQLWTLREAEANHYLRTGTVLTVDPATTAS